MGLALKEDQPTLKTTYERYVGMIETFAAEQLENIPALHIPWYQQKLKIRTALIPIVFYSALSKFRELYTFNWP